jgi:hypothetical protein
MQNTVTGKKTGASQNQKRAFLIFCYPQKILLNALRVIKNEM